MWRLFRRKRQTVQTVSGLWDKLASFIDVRLRRYADLLRQKTEKLSKRTLMACLIGFCILFGGSSLYILAGAFMSPAKSIKVVPISIPRSINEDSPLPVPEDTNPPPAVRRIIAFKHYIDSLAGSPQSRYEYDSIIRVRPGLMDSINRVIDLFNSTKNNSNGN